MSIQHVFTNPVGDGTNTTGLVVPSHWNSNHNMVQNFSGNTAGTSQIVGQDIVWAGGSNVTISANGSTASINGPVFVNSNLMSFGTNGSQITASFGDPDNWALYGNTSGTSASTIGTGGLYFQGGNNVTLSGNSNTIIISGPNTVAQSTQTQPAGNIAGVGTTFGGTNVSGSMTMNSNGLALSLSAAAPGGGVNDNVFSAGFVGPQATTSVGQSSLYMQYMQVDGAVQMCRMDQMMSLNIAATTSFTTSTGGTSSTSNANVNNWGLTRSYCIYTQGTGASSTQLLSAYSTSASIGATRGYSYSFSINSNSVTHGCSNGFSFAAVKNIDSTGGVTYTTLGYSTSASTTASSAAAITTTTGTTSIANVSTSNHTGVVAFVQPWGTTLPAQNFWLGMIQASSSTSAGTNSTVMSASNFVATYNSATAYRHLTQTNTVAGYMQVPGNGVYSAATGAFPATIGFTQINNNTVFSNGQFPTVMQNITL